MTKPGNFIIAGGIFILVMFTGTWLVSSAAIEDSSWINETVLQNYNSTFTSYAEYNEKVSDLEEQTSGATGASEDSLVGDAFGFINNLFNKGWQTIRLLGSNFSFIYSIFTSLSDAFGIPTWLTGMAVSLLTVMLAFGLLSLIFGREAIK